MRTIFLLAGGMALVAAAPVKLAPADDKPAQPVGAAARAKHGPEPLAKPADDAGMAEDPPGAAVPDPQVQAPKAGTPK